MGRVVLVLGHTMAKSLVHTLQVELEHRIALLENNLTQGRMKELVVNIVERTMELLGCNDEQVEHMPVVGMVTEVSVLPG